jgi:hypothetical protein
VTERLGREGGVSQPWTRRVDGEPDLVSIAIDGRLVGGLADVAAGRLLVIDFLVTRPSWSVPEAVLSARLQAAAPPGWVRIATLEGVTVVAEPRLVGVLRDVGLTLRPVAGAILGQFDLGMERPFAWLDFLATAVRRP